MLPDISQPQSARGPGDKKFAGLPGNGEGAGARRSLQIALGQQDFHLKDDRAAQLEQRLASAQEVIRQLKTVIRAQHGKIEDLQAKITAAEPPSGVAEEAARSSDAELEGVPPKVLEMQVRSLRGRLKQLQSRNMDLKRVNRRLNGLLGQDKLLRDTSTNSLHVASAATLPSSVAPTAAVGLGPGKQVAPLSPDDLDGANVRFCDDVSFPQHHEGSAFNSEQEGGHPSRQALARAGTSSLGLGSSKTLQPRYGMVHISRTLTLLWKQETSALLVKDAMLAADRAVESSGGIAALYVLDQWLQNVLAESCAQSKSSHGEDFKPTIFYLKGKLIHGYSSSVNRPQAPRFSDLASLPIRAGSFTAVPLQATPHQPILAVLQVVGGQRVMGQTVSENTGGESQSKLLVQKQLTKMRSIGNLELVDKKVSEISEGHPSALQLSDFQFAGLCLLGSNIAGQLEKNRKLDYAKAINHNLPLALNFCTEATAVKRWRDFEHIAKLQLAKLFNVATVRLSYYDGKELLVLTHSGSGHKVEESGKPAVTKSKASDSSICGRVVHTLEVMNIPRLSMSNFLNEVTDGVDLRLAHEWNMLAGPLVVRASTQERPKVLGCVQLINKRRAPNPVRAQLEAWAARNVMPPRRGGGEGFTPEDVELFTGLLGPLGVAAAKIIEAQLASRTGVPGTGGPEDLLLA